MLTLEECKSSAHIGDIFYSFEVEMGGDGKEGGGSLFVRDHIQDFYPDCLTLLHSSTLRLNSVLLTHTLSLTLDQILLTSSMFIRLTLFSYVPFLSCLFLTPFYFSDD